MVIFIFTLSNFESVVKVNYLVHKSSQLIAFFQLDSIPELDVSMEYAYFLQLKDPM